eukprot:TRINITY_DN9785_c0_g1_i1.p1 TRINITY_DN9785_c0_g1~~TRINITY_DN9785_c0_g1_i1.p1  ORF type:complete len:173 (+),score=36.15 TRINITY_DN9785_c0_g1_i1:94-612(+)
MSSPEPQDHQSAQFAVPHASLSSHHRTVRALIFDLDQCLYDRSSGLAAHQRRQCHQFFIEHLGVPPADCAALGALTLEGVRQQLPGCAFSDKDFHQFVFARYSEYLADAPGLRESLNLIQIPKIILSNNIRAHCLLVLELLGLSECFDCVISCDELGACEKPHPRALSLIHI